MQRGDRHEGQVADVQPGRERREVRADPLEDLGAVINEVHLVHGEDHVRYPQQGGQERVPPRLLGEPVAGVDQDDREVGRGRAG